MKLNKLMEFAAEQHDSNTYFYLLLDPLTRPSDESSTQISELQAALGTTALTRVERANLRHAPHACPKLLCLASPGSQPATAVLETTVRLAQTETRRRKRHLCGWLVSEAPADVVAAHLASFGELPTEHGKARLYPIFEPLRLELFASAFERTNLGPWWPIKSWLFISSGGHDAVLEGNPQIRSPLPSHASDMQNEVGLIGQMLDMWRGLLEQPAAYAASPGTEIRPLSPVAATLAWNQIQQLRAQGVTNRHDIVLLALVGLVLHPDLHKHPAMLEVRAQATSQPGSLAQRFEHYNDATWKNLIAQLAHQEYPT